MLGHLVDYARRHELVAEPGFAPKTVRWGIACDAAGRFLEVLPLGDPDDPKSPGRTFPKCPELSQPEMKRGGPGCRHFLVDSADVVALLADGEPDAKLLAKHAYFTGLLRRAAAVMSALAGVADTLDDPGRQAEIQARLRTLKARPTDKVTFSISGATPPFPVQSDAWHDWWRRFRRELAPSAKDAPRARCLATGELVEPAPTHPKIAGLADVGGLSMGDSFASFKQESFCSYGLSQSANAPVSEEGAAEYRAALNRLIREDSRKLAGARVVPWFKKSVPTEQNPFSFLLDEISEEADARHRARELLDAIETGGSWDLRDNYYYVLTLSGAAGRVMVRDWMEGRFEDLARSVAAWFDALAIVRPDGRSLSLPPRFFHVLAALVRELNEETRKELASLEARLWRAALRCEEPIPQAAMNKALARAKIDILTDRPLNPTRMGLLKAFHIRKGDRFMEPNLNENHTDPAYHCGRLMAMLAALQYRALGDVGAGVVQRYYAAASTTPALVLGRLVRTAQFHLDKLDRGLARWHEGRIADTFGRIRNDIPATLSLERQSLFALGYYQQIASDRSRTKAADAVETPETSSDAQETAHE